MSVSDAKMLILYCKVLQIMEGHYPEKFSSISYQTPQLANQGLQTP